MHMKEICYYLEEAKLLLSYCSKKQKSELDHFLKPSQFIKYWKAIGSNGGF